MGRWFKLGRSGPGPRKLVRTLGVRGASQGAQSDRAVVVMWLGRRRAYGNRGRLEDRPSRSGERMFESTITSPPHEQRSASTATGYRECDRSSVTPAAPWQ